MESTEEMNNTNEIRKTKTPEKYIKKIKEYREKNPEKVKQWHEQWYKTTKLPENIEEYRRRHKLARMKCKEKKMKENPEEYEKYKKRQDEIRKKRLESVEKMLKNVEKYKLKYNL